MKLIRKSLKIKILPRIKFQKHLYKFKYPQLYCQCIKTFGYFKS